MSYQGHHNDGSSIQKHSAGSHYPLIVSVVENTGHTCKGFPQGVGFAEVMNSQQHILFSEAYPLGDKPARLAAYERAYEQANQLAALLRGAV